MAAGEAVGGQALKRVAELWAGTMDHGRDDVEHELATNGHQQQQRELAPAVTGDPEDGEDDDGAKDAVEADAAAEAHQSGKPGRGLPGPGV